MSQNVNVNLTPGGYPKEFHVSQYDVGRQLIAKIVDSTGNYSIPSGATVTLLGTKPSGFGFSLTGTVSSGSVVTFTTTATVTAEYGRIPCEIRITNGSTILGTANCMLVVEESPHQEGVIDGNSETVIPELTILVERVEAAASSVLDMQIEADTLPAGSSATYSYDEETNTATFGIPQGEAGAGATGVVAPAYSASSTYAVGDYVIHNSNLYRCTTAITTAEAFTAAHWTQVLLGNDVSDLKSDLTEKTWDIGSYNRFDASKVTNGYISKSGVVTPNNDWHVSDYIPVNPGMVLYANSHSSSSFALYDINKGIVSNSENWVNPFTVPNGVYYIRMTFRTELLTSAYLSTIPVYDEYKHLLPAIHNCHTFNENNVNDNQLSILGVTNVTDFPKNRTYALVGVTTLQGMPDELTAPYNGSLTCIQSSSTNAFPMYIFVTNTGASYIGTSVGSDMRWNPNIYRDINQELSNIYGKKVVLVGDSIMYGSHMSDVSQGERLIINKGGVNYYNNLSIIVWSKHFSDYLTSQYNCTVLNQSFPGCSYYDVSNNLQTLIPSDNDYAIIMLGVNDWGSPISVRTHINTIKKYCKQNSIIPVFITPYPAKDYISQLAQIRGYIKENPQEVGDFYSVFNEMMFLMNVDINSLFDDDIHYNDSAQSYIFESVKRCLHL